MDDTERFIVNLFENEHPNSAYNNTIRIRILQALNGFGQSISLKTLKEILLSAFNYNPYHILDAIKAFGRSRLITIRDMINPSNKDSLSSHLVTIDLLNSDNISIVLTHCGRLHLDLIFKLEYVEIMKFSTYIDATKEISIQGNRNQGSFYKRANSTKAFLKYLKEQEVLEITSIVKDKNIFDQKFEPVIPFIMKRIHKQLDELGGIVSRS